MNANPIEGILEAALYVSDLDAAEHFYGTILQLEKIARAGNRHVFYKVGQSILLIFNPAETEKPAEAGSLPVPTHGARGPGHLCFRVATTQLEAMAGRLEAAGIAIESDFYWPNGPRSIYFRDPAGNSLECTDPVLWGLDKE